MRSEGRAEQIISGVDVSHPIAKCLVYSVFQRSRARIDAANLCTEQPHPKHIDLLPPHIFGAHVNDAFEPKQGTNRRRCDAVLPRSGFGNDPFLAHFTSEQDLPDAVIDLMCACVI